MRGGWTENRRGPVQESLDELDHERALPCSALCVIASLGGCLSRQLSLDRLKPERLEHRVDVGRVNRHHHVREPNQPRYPGVVEGLKGADGALRVGEVDGRERLV